MYPYLPADIMVWTSIEAGKILEAKGISVELINIHTIKPLIREASTGFYQKTGCAVTAEEHNIIGGLGRQHCTGCFTGKLPDSN
jgi:transketolase C-terminal domain/subunit